MVSLCNGEFSKMKEKEYTEIFQQFPFPLSNFQKHSIDGIVTNKNVLVTAHTSNGKTIPAEFAIPYFVLEKKKKVIYTSPIKSLSNQKYWDFTQKFKDISFGIMTGDIKHCPNADVILMTAEILMNYLFTTVVNGTTPPLPNSESSSSFQINLQTELGCVIMDEVHFILDEERGHVWENTIMLIPPHVQLLMLSATMDNPIRFSYWIHKCRPEKEIIVASTERRIVPLHHYLYLISPAIYFKKEKDKTLQQNMKETTNKLLLLKNGETNRFEDAVYYTVQNTLRQFQKHNLHVNTSHVMNTFAKFAFTNNMFPAIVFIFSRNHVEECALSVTTNILEDDNKLPYIIDKEVECILRSRLQNWQEYTELPEYIMLLQLMRRGIGIHHAGMIPILREIVEFMIMKNYLKMIFSTETIAIGINASIKTVVYTSLTKHDGKGARNIYPHEYNQGSGRAGRRGIDSVGHVVHCGNLFALPDIQTYKTILGGSPKKLQSKFAITNALIFSVVKSGKGDDAVTKKYICDFIENSLYASTLVQQANAERKTLKEFEDDLQQQHTVLPPEHYKTYMTLTNVEFLSHKQLKKNQQELEKLLQTYPDLQECVAQYNVFLEKTRKVERVKSSILAMESSIPSEISIIVEQLCQHQFLEKNAEGSLKFTERGEMASYLTEINEIVFSEFMFCTDFLRDLSVVDIAKVLSLFSDVKGGGDALDIPKEFINTFDYLKKITEIHEKFMDMKAGGVKFHRFPNFYLFEEIETWMNKCENSGQCNAFLQNLKITKGVLAGDFIKFIMKISLMGKEIVNALEHMVENESILIAKCKFIQIDDNILKHVCVNQSLYVN